MKSDLLPQSPPETLDYAQDSGAPESLTAPASPPAPTWVRVVVSIALILVILGAAAGVAQLLILTKPVASQSTVNILPALVESQIVIAQDVRESFVGYGTARSATSVVVAAEVGGRVVEMPDKIDDGARVAAGDVLVRIDDRTYRIQLERAQSQLADVEAKLARLDVEHENASRLIKIADREFQVNQAEFERLLKLFERSNASKKEVDFARLAAERSRRDLQTFENQRDLIPTQRAEFRAMKKMRESEISLAELDVERATIAAPLTGHIERVTVEQGSLVMPGMQIARIVDTDHIEVPVELPLSVRTRTHVGSEAVIMMETAPDLVWKAAVVRLAPAADETSRTFIAYLEVDNTTQRVPLVPGAFVTAHVAGDTLTDALVVPRGALVGRHLFVADGTTAVRRKVTIETLIGDRAVVSGELQSGDRVILSNLDILHDGAMIRLGTDVETDRAMRNETTAPIAATSTAAGSVVESNGDAAQPRLVEGDEP